MYLQSKVRTKVRKYLNFLIPLLGMMIIMFMLVFVWFWETKGREIYFYNEVVVLNQDVSRGNIITADMLTTEKFETNKLIQEVVMNKEDIVGLSAKHFIPKYTQLHPLYFEDKQVMSDRNTYFMRIPNEWMYSVPNTLRRKDQVLLYITNQTYTEASENISTFNEEEIQKVKGQLDEFLFKTTVAYVKDSANREIRTLSKEERMDGSSIISEIIILVKPEQLQLLEDRMRDGGKIIIIYSEGENGT